MDRIDLVRLDAMDVLERTERGAALIIAGALFAMVGWMGAMTAIVIALEPYFSLGGAAALSAAVNLLIGGGLVLMGMQRLQGDEEKSPAGTALQPKLKKVLP